MRGYGGTEAPDDYASYNAYTLAADALGLLQRLGIARAVSAAVVIAMASIAIVHSERP